MKKEKKNKKEKKLVDIVIFIILLLFILGILIFTITRETANQEIILMEIYKSAGPNTSSASTEHYYVYENTNVIKIRSSNSDGSNSITSKDMNQDSIDNLKNSLDEYISNNPTINTGFYTNERYTIEYNGTSYIVPNPSVASLLGFDANEYQFYNIVESFVNTIKN